MLLEGHARHGFPVAALRVSGILYQVTGDALQQAVRLRLATPVRASSPASCSISTCTLASVDSVVRRRQTATSR